MCGFQVARGPQAASKRDRASIPVMAVGFLRALRLAFRRQSVRTMESIWMASLPDRYEVYALLPEDARRAELLTLINRVCPGGSIHHVLGYIPEQAEDVYTILVDDHSVVSFDVPRGASHAQSTAVQLLGNAPNRRWHVRNLGLAVDRYRRGACVQAMTSFGAQRVSATRLSRWRLLALWDEGRRCAPMRYPGCRAHDVVTPSTSARDANSSSHGVGR